MRQICPSLNDSETYGDEWWVNIMCHLLRITMAWTTVSYRSTCRTKSGCKITSLPIVRSVRLKLLFSSTLHNSPVRSTESCVNFAVFAGSVAFTLFITSFITIQRCSCRSTTVWTGPGAVCRQRGCSAHIRCPQIRSYDTTSDGLTLAAGATTYPL